MDKKKKILLIDDHTLFREGIRALIERQALFEVIGEAGTARKGLQLAKKLQPDLVVVDISLPDKGGIQLIREIRECLPGPHIMVVSMHSKIEYIAEAFQAGAQGYVIKESASERLLQGLACVARGDYFIDSSVSHEIVKKLQGRSLKQAQVTDVAYGTLTAREQEVMRLLVEGRSSKEVGSALFISPKTVENHRSSIMKKLGLHSTLELVRYAARLGLVDLDLWKA